MLAVSCECVCCWLCLKCSFKAVARVTFSQGNETRRAAARLRARLGWLCRPSRPRSHRIKRSMRPRADAREAFPLRPVARSAALRAFGGWAVTVADGRAAARRASVGGGCAAACAPPPPSPARRGRAHRMGRVFRLRAARACAWLIARGCRRGRPVARPRSWTRPDRPRRAWAAHHRAVSWRNAPPLPALGPLFRARHRPAAGGRSTARPCGRAVPGAAGQSGRGRWWAAHARRGRSGRVRWAAAARGSAAWAAAPARPPGRVPGRARTAPRLGFAPRGRFAAVLARPERCAPAVRLPVRAWATPAADAPCGRVSRGAPSGGGSCSGRSRFAARCLPASRPAPGRLRSAACACRLRGARPACAPAGAAGSARRLRRLGGSADRCAGSFARAARPCRCRGSGLPVPGAGRVLGRSARPWSRLWRRARLSRSTGAAATAARAAALAAPCGASPTRRAWAGPARRSAPPRWRRSPPGRASGRGCLALRFHRRNKILLPPQ